MKNLRLFFFLCLAWSFAATQTAWCQNPLKADAKTDSTKPPLFLPERLTQLRHDLDGIIDDPNFANAEWGAIVQSVETGEYLYRKNDTKLFVPASNLKLFTTAAALYYLGPDFRYATSLLTNGTIRKGVLQGDVIIRGSGDPTFSKIFYPNQPLAVLERWADTLEARGVKRIAGNIIGDDSYFDSLSYAPGWEMDDESYYYSAQISGLSLNNNCVDLTVQPGVDLNDEALIEIFPNTTYVTISNEVKTTRGDSTFAIDVHRDPGTNVIHVTGNIPLNYSSYTLSATVDNPCLFASTVFRETLAKRGIEVDGSVLSAGDLKEKIVYPHLKTLDIVFSPPLSEIIKQTNQNSLNFCAEQILKTIAKERTGTGSFEKGVEMVKKFLSDVGIPPEHISMVDGSGLSRLDLISPQYMATLLRYMHRSDNWKYFYASLPVAGKSGTLESRMKETKAEGNVHAKTGYLNFVRSLSGYVNTADNDMLLFSLFTNNYTVPTSLADNVEDLVLMYLANFHGR
ncbi:MAG TPA: D-alanyl-D-alanine carboxypeptidase/D-alanyl-D-alanine-endopeptidase [Candidatus Kapabacteria bacterium]|nr:D-alanyl-D-alanine carboxypeptidase/D-alanyl-D-alanine-endopeptidase [Candidatus Kapabacteria bacterium]